jgi:hypothetical protein
VNRKRNLRTVGRVDVGFAIGVVPVRRDRDAAVFERRRDRRGRVRRPAHGDERPEEVERDYHAGRSANRYFNVLVTGVRRGRT